jgi:hypothetical protein
VAFLTRRKKRDAGMLSGGSSVEVNSMLWSLSWEKKPRRGRLAVVLAKAAEEMGVRDEAAPPLADERGAREGGRQRREAPEDLGQDVVVVQRGRRRRRAGEDREVTA